MSYPFIANGANTKLIFELQEKYSSLFKYYFRKAEIMTLSPDYTEEEYYCTLNTAYSHNYVTMELSQINKNQSITASKLQELKKAFWDYNDPALLTFLDNAFNFSIPKHIASPRQRPLPLVPAFSSKKASRLERQAIENLRRSHAPSSSSLDVPSVRKSPRITPRGE